MRSAEKHVVNKGKKNQSVFIVYGQRRGLDMLTATIDAPLSINKSKRACVCVCECNFLCMATLLLLQLVSFFFFFEKTRLLSSLMTSSVEHCQVAEREREGEEGGGSAADSLSLSPGARHYAHSLNAPTSI